MHPDTIVEAAYIQRPSIIETLEAMNEAMSGPHRTALFQLNGDTALALIDLLDEVSASR